MMRITIEAVKSKKELRTSVSFLPSLLKISLFTSININDILIVVIFIIIVVDGQLLTYLSTSGMAMRLPNIWTEDVTVWPLADDVTLDGGSGDVDMFASHHWQGF